LGLISYPRTDCHFLPSGFPVRRRLGRIATWPHRTWAELSRVARIPLQESLPGAEALLDSTQVIDHHAIVPTGQSPPEEGLSGDVGRVFPSIVGRFVEASRQPSASWCIREREVVVDGGGESVRFRTHASALIEPGFRQGRKPAPRWMDEPPLTGVATVLRLEIGPLW
ncbi:MAG: DNA topoisomerase, partial [Myxococcota bacterium]